MFRNLTKYGVMLILAYPCVAAGQETGSAKEEVKATSLPFPKDFEPERYLGKWYEIGRLAAPSQPAKTLATAEYSAGKNQGEILVKNTAYDAEGASLRTIEGKAKLFEDDPPRLAVGFGPSVPAEPNYYVMHVSKKYDLAVVGNPDRKSLWILSRKPELPRKRLERMIRLARRAGFPTDDLIISDWKSALAHLHKADFEIGQIVGNWKYASGEKDGLMLDEEHFAGQTVEITRETITLKSEEFTFVIKYDLVDGSEPQAAKLTITKSPFGAGQETTGILEVKDDTLKLCYRPTGGAAPTKFEGKTGSGQHFFVLERLPKKFSAEAMVGEWQFVSGVVEGNASEEDRLEDSSLSITEDALTLKSGDAKFVMNYKLDTTQQPTAIELEISEGPFGEGSTSEGIVKMSEGMLYICYSPRGGEAPTKFEAGSEYSLFILRPNQSETAQD